MPEKELVAIAIMGQGRLMGLVLEKAMKTYKQATFFDRTAEAVAAIQREIDLGEAGLLDEEGREMTKKAKANLKKPIPTTVEFKMSSDTEAVVMKSAKGSKSLKYEITDKTSIKDLEKYANEAVRELGKLI